jgi:hypothetical protein
MNFVPSGFCLGNRTIPAENLPEMRYQEIEQNLLGLTAP